MTICKWNKYVPNIIYIKWEMNRQSNLMNFITAYLPLLFYGGQYKIAKCFYNNIDFTSAKRFCCLSKLFRFIIPFQAPDNTFPFPTINTSLFSHLSNQIIFKKLSFIIVLLKIRGVLTLGKDPTFRPLIRRAQAPFWPNPTELGRPEPPLARVAREIPLKGYPSSPSNALPVARWWPLDD